MNRFFSYMIIKKIFNRDTEQVFKGNHALWNSFGWRSVSITIVALCKSPLQLTVDNRALPAFVVTVRSFLASLFRRSCGEWRRGRCFAQISGAGGLPTSEYLRRQPDFFGERVIWELWPAACSCCRATSACALSRAAQAPASWHQDRR